MHSVQWSWQSLGRKTVQTSLLRLVLDVFCGCCFGSGSHARHRMIRISIARRSLELPHQSGINGKEQSRSWYFRLWLRQHCVVKHTVPGKASFSYELFRHSGICHASGQQAKQITHTELCRLPCIPRIQGSLHSFMASTA